LRDSGGDGEGDGDGDRERSLPVRRHERVVGGYPGG
jgi:hypothetical protein